MVLVVDESRGLIRQHLWLKSLISHLEQELLSEDFGTGDCSNLFGLVGFGQANKDNQLGRVSFAHNGAALMNWTHFMNTLPNLYSDPNSGMADGYAGISHALDRIPFRKGCNNVKPLILFLTDADRMSILRALTRDTIQQLLSRSKAGLHVVVNNRFQAGGRDLLGVATLHQGVRVGYRIASDGFFSFVTNGIVIPSGRRSTKRDYVDLALELGGSAWDVRQVTAADRGRGLAAALSDSILKQLAFPVRPKLLV